MIGSLILAAGGGDGVPVTDIYGVLVALIGMAGVLGSALIIQIFSTRRAAASNAPITEVGLTESGEDVALLHERIGRLEAQLELCEERTPRAKKR